MNNIAKEAYHTATNINRIYTRLGVARDILALALDEAPLGFEDAQFKRINDLRNAISSEMALINDFSKREAHRICHTDPKSQIAALSESPSGPADNHTGLPLLNSDEFSPPDPTFIQVHNLF